MKQTGHIGFGVNDKKELKILNRTIKIDVLNDEMTLEADTKLVENALESMKLKGAKGVDSPRVRTTDEQTAQIENSEKLTSAESTLYRSMVMKLAYVAEDRVDNAEAVQCFTRHMKEPRSGHMQELMQSTHHRLASIFPGFTNSFSNSFDSSSRFVRLENHTEFGYLTPFDLTPDFRLVLNNFCCCCNC